MNLTTLARIFTLIILGLFGAFFQGTAFADVTRSESSIPIDRIQSRIDQLAHDLDIPGMVIGFEVQGERWIGSTGVADLETKRPMTVDTQFRLASVTKTFTATLVLKLAELGKLSLDDTVEKWLPGQIANSDKITLSMLLNHTGGVHDHESINEMFVKMLNDPTHSWSMDEIMGWINSVPPDFEPGTDYSYSNSGYYLLGLIAEKAGGDTVDALTQKHLFSPAGMARTRLTREGVLEAPYTPGYFRIDGEETVMQTGDWNLSWDWTAGSGVSTAGDLLSWARALFSGKLVNQENLTKMKTPIPPSVTTGFGIVISQKERFGVPVYSHNGYNPGALAGWYYFPDSACIMVFGINYTEYRAEHQMAYANSVFNGMKEIYDIVRSYSSVEAEGWEGYR